MPRFARWKKKPSGSKKSSRSLKRAEDAEPSRRADEPVRSMGRFFPMKPREEKQPESNQYDLGLRFFAENSPVTLRRRRVLFVLAWCGVSAMMIWPIYPLMSKATPLVLGLPLSLVWVLIAMVLMFGALLWLFFGDEAEARRREKEAQEPNSSKSRRPRTDG